MGILNISLPDFAKNRAANGTMGTRLQTQKDKEALKETLRTKCRNNEMRPGDRLPTLRELTKQYNLSMPTVANALQELVAEGLLHFIPRAGTFVGPGKGTADQTFLFVLAHPLARDIYETLTQRSFEAAIVAQGGTCLTVLAEQVAALAASGALEEIAGVFEFQPARPVDHILGNNSVVPRIAYRQYEPGEELSCDVFDFDQHDGGRQAAQHLFSRGHRRIAFLGAHSANEGYAWSRQRAAGWREVLIAEKQHLQGMEFLPERASVDYIDQIPAAKQVVASFFSVLRSGEIDAVVAANHIIAHQLLVALQQSELSREKWPGIVSFDDMPDYDSQFVSALRLPWDELGAQAAQLLGNRVSGQKSRPFAAQLVKMNLMPRLSSRSIWSQASGIDALMFPAHSELTPDTLPL